MLIEGKDVLILAYLVLVVATCLWPFLLLARPRMPSPIMPTLFCAGLVTGAGTLLAVRGIGGPLSPVVLALILILPLLPSAGAMILSGLAALPLVAGATWWDPAAGLESSRVLAFVLLGLAAAALPRLRVADGLPRWAVLAMLALASALLMLATAPFSVPLAFRTLWHHWGAYIAPAEALLAGGVPFRDFPVQYGIGPTLVIAALCRTDCWPGTYWAVVVANLLYLLALGGCVLLLTRQSPRGVAALALLALAASVLFWTGYPPDFMGALAVPSVAGLRFLPLALLLLQILRSEDAGRPSGLTGHALWLFSLAWSPEAGFFALLVWWPYLALRRAQASAGSWSVMLVLLDGALRAVLALCLAGATLALLFRLVFGDWPSMFGFLAYVRNPPGNLPPNLQGPLWLMLAAVAAGLVAMSRSDPRRSRMAFVCTTALVAVSAYYLGRSHDNNILNLFPFLVVALVAPASSGMPDALLGFSRTVMAGLVAWIATFGIGGWRQAWQTGHGMDIGPLHLLYQMRLVDAEAQALIDTWTAMLPDRSAPTADAAAALRSLPGTTAPVLVSAPMLLPRTTAGRAWTGVNNLANYGLLPAPVIEHFVRRGAETYRLPGWLVVDQLQAGPWLNYFRTAYDVAEERAFGGYIAYRLLPR
ncbi:hypothetical protein [Plastoroseomonas hellenica]|uniref:hypothetical protein n=1 Tax=Plastoroseomonas hellenica TaxID=2687306 RepID=UPI001BAC6C6A|nr:hypothetical protein [Plastoroseomonas hellenica]MBR0644713.1 hypothetical protein [Plastoroseomonas hellenica]